VAGCEREPLSRSRRRAGRSSSSCSKRLALASKLGLSTGVEHSKTTRSQVAPTMRATSALGTRQYARLVDEWVTAIGLRREDYGTHSLRRTKASIIYKATGNLRAVQLLLGHTKIESPVRYLGVDVEDALTLAEHTEV
jgi:site-specific recombinase XerC